MNKSKTMMTGAEVLSSILEKANVKYVFAYPGTSELALCDAIIRNKSIILMNGRGDKESAFMAAGGSLLNPLNSAAILHGARGGTNALGAIADAHRNEVPVLFIVGLPSTSSQPFLPPHGEWNLIKKLGNFVKYSVEIKDTSPLSARNFCSAIYKALEICVSYPYGPVIIGFPQDVSEKKWIPKKYISYRKETGSGKQTYSKKNINKTIHAINKSNRPVIYIDDFFYKFPRAKEIAKKLAQLLHAPIFQVFYGRGPMLFERLTKKVTSHFLGCYNPADSSHQKIMSDADLLITIEDRNMYPRVVGQLPDCRKIAITSNPVMTKKNNYLTRNDLVLEGDVGKILEEIYSKLDTQDKAKQRTSWYAQNETDSSSPTKTDSKYAFMRTGIAKILSEVFKKVKSPILVDDSQMFGGLLSEGYDLFPSKLRVFGDHGAFIGGGLALSAGLAKCEPDATVFCTLGDQSFTNAIQGLVSAVQQKIKIIYIVCNNSKSVSLMKQILSQDPTAFDSGKNTFLNNAPINYSALTKSLKINTYTIPYIPNHTNKSYTHPNTIFRKSLAQALKTNGPTLIELQLPSDPDAWKGIWTVKGNEK